LRLGSLPLLLGHRNVTNKVSQTHKNQENISQKRGLKDLTKSQDYLSRNMLLVVVVKSLRQAIAVSYQASVLFEYPLCAMLSMCASF